LPVPSEDIGVEEFLRLAPKYSELFSMASAIWRATIDSAAYRARMRCLPSTELLSSPPEVVSIAIPITRTMIPNRRTNPRTIPRRGEGRRGEASDELISEERRILSCMRRLIG
jgi:hypothetical protein